MAWIESHQSLLNHSKTLLAAQELGMDKYKFLGHLHALWYWGLDNADIDGYLPAGTTELTLATAAGIPKKMTEKFVKTLISVRFIDEIPDNFQKKSEKFGKISKFSLHDWYQYAGKINAKREANRQRMCDARATHKSRTCAECAPATCAPPTVPTVPTVPNQENNNKEKDDKNLKGETHGTKRGIPGQRTAGALADI